MNTNINTNLNTYVEVIDNFLSKEEADSLLEKCNTLELNIMPEVRVFGKVCHQNRDVKFYSDESSGYKYSGQIAKANALPDFFKPLLEKINNKYGVKNNGILVNRYISKGERRDYIGDHADDEKDLSLDGCVYSLSLGGSRILRFKSKTKDSNNETKVYNYPTKHGQLLIMKKECQKKFTHGIPKSTKEQDTRYSLTFRTHTK